ncbi:MAG: hypothetical protein PHQ54_00140 [Candidatus Omnitrophica bacterium]|nr:hypothetical protein [Candidatus Omnitrophota bacterium]
MKDMKGWALKETLLVIIILGLIASVLIPGYNLATKRAIAQNAIRTAYLLSDVVTEHYIRNGNFSRDLKELNLNRINDAEKNNFNYRISGFSIEEYEIIASGQSGSPAEGIIVSYNPAQKRYYIEYLGKLIEGRKHDITKEVF